MRALHPAVLSRFRAQPHQAGPDPRHSQAERVGDKPHLTQLANGHKVGHRPWHSNRPDSPLSLPSSVLPEALKESHPHFPLHMLL